MVERSRLSPARLSHVGIQTFDVNKSRDWYCAVLGAHVVFEKPGMFCVVAYDEEHHRVAIVGLPNKPRRKFAAQAEIMHVGYAMEDVFALLENYERLKAMGIMPEENVNHGVSLSCYYRDPDGNQIELFADRFKTMQECTDWMFGEVYQHNHGAGVFFDADALLERMKAGDSEEELLRYPVEEGLNVDMAAFAGAHVQSFLDEADRYDAEVAAAAKS